MKYIIIILFLVIPMCSYGFDKSFFDFDENLITVTKYEVLSLLPDPFLFDNGKRVKTKEDWDKRREEIYKYAVELQYGTIPPQPEVLKYDLIYLSNSNEYHKNLQTRFYRIICGTKEKQLTFFMKLMIPLGVERPNIVLDGDLCFQTITHSYYDPFFERGIAYATFNRCELADDMGPERRKGPLYEIYPDYSFGAIGAWAWGFMRCADVLEKLDMFDMSLLTFTGHSRGAKTAMLAGVLDERAKIVNPNQSNCGSCSCYRIHFEGEGEDGFKEPGETLKDLWNAVHFWVGEDMGKYVDNEADLPFDCHYLKALVAPRVLLVGEAANDLWTNPIGSWQTSEAAKEVYDFLGCKDNLKWYFRRGYHSHTQEDSTLLVNLIMNLKEGEELLPYYYKTPFKPYEKIWDWKKPEK